MMQELGDMEGEVNILAWPGYAEDGSTDKSVDWVTPFEEETGCQANVKYFGTSDEAVQLMHSGEYDVVSASGDASLRLIASGDAAPVNTDLLENYADIEEFLKDRSWNSVDGQMYGVPHGWGANLLMYNTEEVSPAPTSWSAVFDDASDYAGKVTAYDSPIYIADAALYLMNTQPDLGIKDPYALDEEQLQAAVDLLKQQKEHVSEYWSDYLKEVAGVQERRLGDRHHLAGHRVGGPGRGSQGRGVPARRGLDRLVGHLDDQLGGREPQLRLRLDGLHHQPGGAGGGRGVLRRGAGQHQGLRPDLGQDLLRHLPRHRRGLRRRRSTTGPRRSSSASTDGRTRTTKCTDYGDWTTAWTEVKG